MGELFFNEGGGGQVYGSTVLQQPNQDTEDIIPHNTRSSEMGRGRASLQ